MIITFSPQRSDSALLMSKLGDVLTINDDVVDLSVVPGGASLPADAISNEFFVGSIERIDGDLHVTLLLPHGPNPSQQVAFPESLVNPADGQLVLPTDVEVDA